MRTPRARKRLTVERLEDRVVPAAHPVAVAGAAAYRYGDQLVTLDSRADELVVGLPGGAAALAALAADHGPLAGLAADRWLTPELVVLAAPHGRLAAAAAAPGVTFAAPVYQNPDTGGWLVATNEVIVALAAGADTSALADPRFSSWVPLSGTPDQFVVKAAAGYGAAAFELAESLHGDPRFAWAAPNFYQDVRKHFTPNDALYLNQWHLNNTAQQSASQVVGTDVDAPLAWDVTQGSQNVVVSVVDDGMEMIHPDLAPNIAINQGEIPAAVLAALTDKDGDGTISFLDLNHIDNSNIGPGKAVDVNANGRIDPDDLLAAAGVGGWIDALDGDGNGYLNDLCGWDFTTNGAVGDNNPGADGVNDAHSTSVAGVAVGVGNNTIGTTGLAFRSRMLPVRIFGTTGASTTSANIGSAVHYAAGRTRDGLGTFRSGDVMNNSWGGGSPSAAITAAFTWASNTAKAGRGVPTFVSSGNEYSALVSYPSNLAGALGGVISVGASTDQANRSGYSSYGPELDFVAPSNGGVAGIRTTDRTGTLGYNGAAGTAGDYTTSFGGTSSASPLAAGIGALILAVNPLLTAAQVRALMRNTTDYIGPTRPGYDPATGFNPEVGYGQVNANRAVRGVGVTEVQLLDDRANVADGSGSVNFGSEPVGGAGLVRVLRVRNQGTLPLTLAALNVTGPFELVSGFGSTTLAVGQSTSFVVRFRPAAAGAAAGGVTFTTNDADEGTFDFALTGTGVAPSLAGRVFEDWDGDGTADANDPSVTGRAAFLDVNTDGSYTAVGAATPFASGTLNTALPDATVGGTATTVTNTRTVSGTVGVVAKVTVAVNVTHTRLLDLELELLGPTGVLVPLALRRGGTGDNFTNTVFDDAAGTAIGSGTAPFTGSFRPERPLSALNGTPANGSWTLRVRDMNNLEVGTLVNWTLGLSLAEPTMTTAAAGTYAFGSLAAGSHTVRTTTPAGWALTAPAGGGHTQTLAAGGSVTGLDFATVRQNAVYGQMVHDLNGNGVRDGGEPVMAGWRVFDDRDNDGVLDGGEVNALTDALGNYVLPGLAAGATRFRVERQAGYRTTLGVGGLALTVVTNETYHTRDFGAVVDTTAPTADVTDVTPDPRTTAQPSVTIVFSEAVTGFDLSDLTLRRDGGANLLTGSQTLTTSDGITWTLGNLSGLTGAVGAYVLTATAAASGVQDAAQNTLAANASDTWTVIPAGVLSVSDVAVGEAGGPAVFVVSLPGASPDTITVNYATANGTATIADGDYASTSGSLTFLPGDLTKTVSVPVANDPRNEVAETFVLNLSAPTNATIADGQGVALITDDDPLPALSIDSVTVTEGTSGNVPLAFTVTLSAASGQTVTVNFATANGTALVLDGDYAAASGTLTFAPGETTQLVTVQAASDARDEINETFLVNLTGVVNATISAATGTGTITDDDPTPTLAIGTVTQLEGTGGTTPFVFTVSLSAVSGQTVSVNYATANGTATVGDGDYTATSGTLTFLPGETTQTVTVPVAADARDEDNEAFTVTLSAPTNAGITTATGTGTITDDDDPPALSINPLTLAEGGGAFGFTVTLSAVSGKTVTVNYGTADGTATVLDGDYVAASGTLTFAPGETSKAVTVPVTSDARNEDDETLTVTLSAPSNATISAATVTGTITDDDPLPALAIDSLTQLEGIAGTTPFVFTVSLSAVSGRTVSVNYATANGTALVLDGDYAAASGTLTFAPGETSKAVVVQVTADARDEINETFAVTLSGPTNATITTATGTGTITDDDPTPTLSVSPVSLGEGSGGTTPFAFTVTLSAVSGQTVSVNYATADGTATVLDGDYAATGGTLTFLPGETTQTVTVPVTADARDEDDEAFTVTLSAPTNAGITTATGTGAVADDDAPPALSINPLTLAEGGGAFAFTVTLSAVSGKTVSVNYATADGTATVLDGDYVAASGTLTFAPGETTKNISVPVTSDARNEDDEAFTVTLSAPSNATIPAATVTGTITDDDPLPALAIGGATQLEGTGGTTSFVFTVSLSAVSGRTVTVNYATANGTALVLDGDYAATSGTLTFAPGETSKTVTVQAAGDARDEINETFLVTLSGPTNATITTATGTGTITDDDPTPTLAINSVSRLEGNSGSTPFAFTVTLSAVSGRTVTVGYATATGTATTGDGDFTATSGTLTFAPGETTKTVTVQAAGDTRNETDETFAVNLSGPGNATIATGTGTGTITNDDPLPTLSVVSVTQAEGTGGTTTFTFTVSLSAASGRTVTVGYATADGTATVLDGDYTAASGTLTFAPDVTTRTFTVAVAGDARNEDAETFGVALSLPGNAALGAATATGTITDDDPVPTLSVNSVSLAEGTGGSTGVAFTVSLSAVSGRTVTVAYATADGSATAADGDYAAALGSVTFAPGETTKTVVVPAAADARNEDDETFALVLGTATNATVAAGTGTATLTNDDPVPTLAVDSVSRAEGDGGTTFTFTVTLSAVSGKTVTVGYATADGSATVGDGDYAASSGTLTFAPGVTTRTFTVAVTGDTRNETDETFTATLSGAANAIIIGGTGTATLVNDDPEPTLAVNSVSAVEGSALAFTVTLSAVSGRTVSVTYATANGTATTADGDYAAASGTLTFTPGETTKTVTVATAGDNTFELDETFALNLGTATNAIVAAGAGTGMVTNDEAVPTATLSGGGTVGESSGSATVTVTLSNPSYLPVTVTLAVGGSAAAGDFDAPPASVTVGAGQLSAAFGIAAIDDGDDEPDETLVLSAAGVLNGTAAGGPVTLTITDDDLPEAAAAGFDLTEDTAFTAPTSLLAAANAQPGSVAELVGAAPAGGTLTLNPDGTFTFTPTPNVHGTVGFQYRVRNPAGEVSAPAAVELRVAAVNDAPTFVPGPDQTDPRRGGAQVVPGWATGISAGPADEAGQRLTFEVTTDNPTLFAVQPAIDPATGTLTYTPGAGFGRAVVTVRLRDDGTGTDASAARAFGVEVLKYRDDNLPTNQDEVGLIGVGSGDAGSVAAFRGDGAAAGTNTPFTGASARVVTADVTGDGVADTIAATGPGVRSRVVVIDGATGAVARTILPFEDTFTGGLFVAAADVDGDGKAEIAVSPDTGGGGRVTVFGGSGAVADFFGIDDKAFRGGARVTFGDVNGDGTPDLVVVAGFGGGPRTALYDGTTLSAGPVRLVNDFFAFPGSDAVNLRNGVFVSAGDVDGDGFADLAFGGGPGGAPRVFVLSGALVSAGRVDAAQAAPVGNFFVAGNASDRGGVRVAVKDLDGDARADVVAGSGEGSAARVRVYAGSGFGGGGEPGDFFDLEPFGGAVLAGGVYVG